MTEQLLAWYGSQPLKDEVMERLRKHRAADAFIQGYYQQLDPEKPLGYRGCALGCTLPKSDRRANELGMLPPGRFEDWHWAIEHFYGIHWRIAQAIDAMFENMPAEECGNFALTVIEAIPVGAELDAIAAWWPDAWMAATRVVDLAPELIERLRNAPVPTPA